ncbi:hypothetical protein Pmar_PMAR003864 [Perkinsus marinus ATCC 50983]|uniref:Uncharacterized protein n=1 Tax=Perkinsus marinus (strain ATCC 50983 / TXsc) TaxID=423536 RepID=C5LZK5_PERM5|nr:hypothetical protein Pmar_PMAR003864 [Perkinsus marinus ATCC 50983]EEQ97840.1 hypothetical protein Pmar_PMAR003864 [Perkinsus marinus ATCC 50983]|eukprot:XP_002765123.1 hypothetical protein Pmar_PMAR003864 [Perkinsus marinus ATCC 50983]
MMDLVKVHRNGTRYVGQFVDDVKHGRGLAMHRNGLINAEVWDRGILVSKAPVFEEIYSNNSQQQLQDGVVSPRTSYFGAYEWGSITTQLT